jgi:hypothetical protein
MLNDDYGQRARLAHTLKSGGNWFFWIAGLSLITSILSLSGANWRFFLSLGITQIIDGFAAGLATAVGTPQYVNTSGHLLWEWCCLVSMPYYSCSFWM